MRKMLKKDLKKGVYFYIKMANKGHFKAIYGCFLPINFLHISLGNNHS